MSAPIIVFDLDGTLVDTAPDLIDTLNVILGKAKLPPVPQEAARTLIGAGVRAMVERALDREGLPRDGEKIDRMFADFLDYYAEHIADRSRAFPGAERALDQLAQEGFVLAICTNKLEWLSRRLLDALDLTRRFAAICGQDTFGVRKPDPAIWRQTLARAGGNPRNAVMVGDSQTDIALARAAGAPVIAVDFGYTEIPVHAFDPDRVISHFDHLVASVRELLPQKI